jgi:hypothetical protein
MPARTALLRAARWFVDNGFVKDTRLERIRRSGRLHEIDIEESTESKEV